jgi:hypothetical protein
MPVDPPQPVTANGGGEVAARLRAALAAARKDQLDSVRVLAVLIRKLGGTARITGDDLLAAADGTLTRMDCDGGFVLTVTGGTSEGQ